jgi:type II secretory pathway pseudopilin PulG
VFGPSIAAIERVALQSRRLLRRVRSEDGFTLIELAIAALLLVIIAAPLSAILLSSSAIAAAARERTAADQLAQAGIETIRTLAYAQVGVGGGNPSGVLSASAATSLPAGEKVTVATAVTWVGDSIPGAYVTNADYKKVVLTVTRQSDGVRLAQKTTYVASASAPPLHGTGWVLIKRTVVDAVLQAPIAGASVHLTGGPAADNRVDTTDAAGVVDFPALASSSTIPPPNFTLATTLVPYLVFPDDISPGAASLVPATPGLNSVSTLRLYKPGVSLTVNVQGSGGAPYLAGATVSVDSSRCGLQTVSIPVNSSSVTITNCNYAAGKSVSLVPNATGLSPLFDKYFVTAWSGSNWGATPSSGIVVPSAYPTALSQSVTVKFGATTYPTTKTATVTVTKNGVNDASARVELTGGPASVYLFGTTNASGQVAFTIPVTSTASTYTVNANDMGVAKGTATFSASTSNPASYSASVAIS